MVAFAFHLTGDRHLAEQHQLGQRDTKRSLRKELFIIPKISSYLNNEEDAEHVSPIPWLLRSTAVDVFDLLVVDIFSPVASGQLPVLDRGQSNCSMGLIWCRSLRGESGC